ncbi:hypothetical protein KY290_010993 [Solanum tuberosum]|uniref:Uncharacterized protein n=1 Tax=Solanum tuberosum TaxID=4113 RepID=A0ABQ7VZF0_SOLTU|nr:hypothetical protein KY290_010993 [Solanum tuberosum]
MSLKKSLKMSLKKNVKTGLKMSMKTILKISWTMSVKMSLKMTHHDWDDVKVDKHREGNTVKAVKATQLTYCRERK